MIKLVVDNTKQDLASKLDAISSRQGFQGRAPEEITRALIDRLAKEPLTGTNIYIRDTEVVGFKLHRDPKGRIRFVYPGRVGRDAIGSKKNRVVNTSLGLAKGKESVSVATARTKAAALRLKTRHTDPVEERRAKLRALEAAREADAAKLIAREEADKIRR